jgi:hypothetical protein
MYDTETNELSTLLKSYNAEIIQALKTCQAGEDLIELVQKLPEAVEELEDYCDDSNKFLESEGYRFDL